MANNQDNLKGHGFHERTAEEQRAIATRGGEASGEARRRKRDLRNALEALLEKNMTAKDGKQMTGTEAITAKLFEQALKGNVKAFETIRATVGQDPIQKIVISEVDQSIINEVEAIVKGEAFGNAAAGAKDMTGKILKIEPESGKIENTYKTAAQAARENGIDPSNLAKAIKSGKTIGGFRWEKRKN